MKGKARTLFVFAILSVFILAIFCTHCTSITGGNSKADVRGAAYADPQTCANCHKNVADNYAHTAHFNTSKPITTNALQKDIVADDNTYAYNDSVKVKVEKKGNGLYQTLYFKNKGSRSQRFDVAFGSGEKAQTYAYWNGNKLLELPLSYFKEIHNWANSPGFPNNGAYFDRLIISRCVECHGSYAKTSFVQTGGVSTEQEYAKDSVLYGIDCQRCHGPAAQHVEFQTENPQVKTARFIASFKKLNRQQKIDMCAVCHSGNDKETLRPLFDFKPGDELAAFYDPYAMPAKTPDVHGNQTGLLYQSKCFLHTATLTCTTCHDTHKKETGDLAAYSQKCMTCHSEAQHNFCKMAPELGTAIANKCIDCHMPTMASKLITYKTAALKQNSSYYLHTHRIASYPEKTKEIIAYIKNTAPVQNAR